MSGKSAIEWTEETWNPIAGCSMESPGCKLCYAMPVAWRLQHNPHPAIAAKYEGTARLVKGTPVFTGRVNLDQSALLAPLQQKRPTLYFVNSMSDLFHPNVPDDWIDRIFAVMALCPQHTFQVLTKRAERMQAWFERYDMAHDHNCADFVADAAAGLLGRPGAKGGARYDGTGPGWPLRNVWLGVSVEDQRRAFERIPHLLSTPAAVRFLSCEPLIEAVDLLPWLDPTGACCGGDLRCANCPADAEWRFSGPCTKYDMAEPQLHWVICGGESGSRARPMHPDWARSLREQCAEAGVPFFFKQWGSCLPCDWDGETASGRGIAYAIDEEHSEIDYDDLGRATVVQAHGREFARFSHKRTGRLLDHRHHDAMPEVQA